MAIGSGLGSQVGFSAESTYGTRVAAAKFIRAKSYRADRAAARVQGEGILAGNYGDLAAHYVETTNAGTGTMAFDVQDRGLGVIWNTLMGGTVTPSVVVTSSAYTASFPLADTYGKAVTFNVGLPYRSGTAISHELAGSKIIAAEFSCAQGGVLECSIDLDAKSWTDGQAVPTASYPTQAAPFTFRDMAVKTGTYNSESVVSGVRAMTCRIERPHDVEDYTANNAGAKSEPVLNGPTQITGTIEADWLAKADFQDKANGTTSTSLLFEWVQATAYTASNFPTFRIQLPGALFEPATQGVEGRDALTNTWNYRWSYDGTNQPRIFILSPDSAL